MMLTLIFIALGFVIGLLLAILTLLALTYFKHGIEKHITVIEKQVSNAGPKPKGFIVEPESEGQQARQAIIDRNRRMGRDTPINDLR